MTKRNCFFGLLELYHGSLIIAALGSAFSIAVVSLAGPLLSNEDVQNNDFFGTIIKIVFGYSIVAAILGGVGFYGLLKSKQTLIKLYSCFYVFLDTILSFAWVVFFPTFYFGKISPIMNIVCASELYDVSDFTMDQVEECLVDEVQVSYGVGFLSVVFAVMFLVKTAFAYNIHKYCKLILTPDVEYNVVTDKLRHRHEADSTKVAFLEMP
jgi:NADH:ubiquinone oxidoreductase subunit K